MLIRQATSRDVSSIAGLHAQSWRDNYQQDLSTQYLAQDIDNERQQVWHQRFTKALPNQQVWLAEIDGHFAGFICLFGAQHSEYGTLVDSIHVAKTVKGQGIGTALLKTAANWAKMNFPNHGLYLEVLVSNQPAIAFYYALGAVKLADSVWHTPCGNNVNEYLLGWSDLEILIR